MFKNPDPLTIPQIEEKISKFWKKNKIFEKSVESRSEDNLYVFYDGPPFISGLPHYGHLLGSIAKDVIPRYWTMRGKRVERVWGWDAHGLTVENKVQKNLNIPKRRDIENYGLEEFTKECYKYTSRVSAEWEWYIDRIARWVDFKNSYKTIDQNYMESVIWAFKQLYDKGLIYEGVYTSMFCPTCGTPVSNFEVTMDNSYRDYEDPGITVKFKILDKGDFKDAYVLAWTTTPWTMPSNRALVVDENEDYVIFEVGSEKFIVAEKRISSVLEEAGNHKKNIFKKFKGEKLIGLTYEPPYKFYAYNEATFKIYKFEGMVNMEEGTGIVHSAPGFGEIDTDMGKQYGIRMMLTLDDEGKFEPGDNGKNPFEGMFYRKSNTVIINDLKDRSLLYSHKPYVHRMPFHDRCDTILIYRAQQSWFVDIKKLKQGMIKTNEEINWVPQHLKEGRFKQGIEQAPDWCISRDRFWATPMPVWVSEDGEKLVLGSIEEIENLSGQKVEDLHRPFIDKIVIKKNGKTYRRIPQVLDSWFEAGSMPYAQMHYPFENKQKFEKNYPGDYIVEYIAQTRAWFFFMHVLANALFESVSFKNVITTGVMAGSDGRKMSKTFQNYTDPKEVLENIGGDALRLYLMNSPLMAGENANFDDVELKNKSRNVLNPLWNSLKYFLIYATLYSLDLKYEKRVPKTKNILDEWIIIRLHESIKNIKENIEVYQIPKATQPVEDFIDDLSRWYVRRSRERISSNDTEAMSTLHYVLLTFSKASAPIIPFMAEEIYLHLKSDDRDFCESVHLETYPDFDLKIINNGKGILESMKKTRDLVSAALSVRVANKVAVRQPLKTIYTTKKYEISEELAVIVKDEVNVKEIVIVNDLDSFESQTMDVNGTISLDLHISEDLRLEGLYRDMVRKFQELRKDNKLNVNDKIEAFYPDEGPNAEVVKKYREDIKNKILADTLEVGDRYHISKI